MTVQKLSNGTFRIKQVDAGDNKAQISALSSSIVGIREQLKKADTAQRTIAKTNRTSETINIEDISGLGIALDKIQKEAKKAEATLTKLSRSV